MQINLTGHHIDITDALRDYVDTKFAKLERHFDHINNVHVNGGEIFADAKHEDMYAAIDGLIDKLDRQVIKHKEKLKKH